MCDIAIWCNVATLVFDVECVIFIIAITVANIIIIVLASNINKIYYIT